MEEKKRKVIKTPKMTVNKLAEYLISKPYRQRGILTQLKYPDDNKFGPTAHTDSREAIKNYLINEFDRSIIEKCIQTLTSKKGSDHQKKVDKSSIETLKTLLESENLEVDAFSYNEYAGDNPKMNIEGVEISVYPDVIVSSTKRNKNYIGALKIHLSRTFPLTDEGGKYVGTILNKFSEDNLVTESLLTRPDHNISFEVFSDNFIECPTSFKKRSENISAGCMTISAIWNSI